MYRFGNIIPEIVLRPGIARSRWEAYRASPVLLAVLQGKGGREGGGEKGKKGRRDEGEGLTVYFVFSLSFNLLTNPFLLVDLWHAEEQRVMQARGTIL